uniref:Uncharacterized protein n=1 Tax=Cacopsylla melanoneura TaxID=428564 RepID=A0A8D9BBC1_9HEMI
MYFILLFNFQAKLAMRYKFWMGFTLRDIIFSILGPTTLGPPIMVLLFPLLVELVLIIIRYIFLVILVSFVVYGCWVLVTYFLYCYLLDNTTLQSLFRLFRGDSRNRVVYYSKKNINLTQ